MWCLVRRFSYIPDANFSESTLFLPVLVWGFSDTPDASQLLMRFTYSLRVQWFSWGLYLTVLMLSLMGSFSYTLDASFSENLTLPMPVLMWSLCYSLHASFSLEEFLLRLLLLVLQWVSFTSLMMIVLAGSSSLDNWSEKEKEKRQQP